MPPCHSLSQNLPANHPDFSVNRLITRALAHYNDFVRFIASISNAPVRLLSGWQPILSPMRQTGDILDSAESQQLLDALYRPSRLPPPESLKGELSREVADFLQLSGLATIGIPAPVNLAVLAQLKVLLSEARIYLGPQDDAWLLQYFARHYRGSYFTLSMIIAAVCPLSQQLNNVVPGLGTALYQILTCQPLRLLFAQLSAESSQELLAESPHAYFRQPKALTRVVKPSAALALPGMQPYFGPSRKDKTYRLTPFTTTLFSSAYLIGQGERSAANKPMQAVRHFVDNSDHNAKHNNATQFFGRIYPASGELFYAVVTAQQEITLCTRGDRPVVYLGNNSPPVFNNKQVFNKNLSTAHVLITRLFTQLVTQLVTQSSTAESALTCAAPSDNLSASHPSSSLINEGIRVITQALVWLDSHTSLLPVAEAGKIKEVIHPHWNPIARRPREIAATLIQKPLTLDKFFPDDYQYLDITRRLKRLMSPNDASMTVLQWVEALLTEETQSYLLDPKDGALPNAIANYYRSAKLEITQQPKSWIVNGFFKYLLHQLNVDCVFQPQDHNALYSLLGRLQPLDEDFVRELAAFIKPNSGSQNLDEILRRVILHLSFPLQHVAQDNYTSHEMRGWKILFGLCLEQYFPARLRGKPIDTANDFINLLGDGLRNSQDKSKIINLLNQPPLIFVFELMTLDLLHEKLTDNQSNRVVDLLSTFRQQEVLRYQILSMGSRAVVERLHALERRTDVQTQQSNVDTIRSSLVSSTAITLKFILSNWFYQSSLARLKVSVLRINFSCWLKPASKQLAGQTLFQGGAFRFEFNQATFFFFIDESGECSYLASSEAQAINELLSNKKFYREGNINEVFFTTTGYELSDIDGGLNLSFEQLKQFGPLSQSDKNGFLEQVAVAFVDNIAFTTPRKNKLLGSTFGTRMKTWYSGLSLELFVPLWGCYESLQDKQQDEIERLIVCSIEAPTATLLVQKSGELIKALRSSFYFSPQDLFTDLSDSVSSLRTLFVSPRHGIYVASEASTEILSAAISPASHTIRTDSASAMITQIHGSSVESFSSVGTLGRSSCYFASGAGTPIEGLSIEGVPINKLQTSASIENIYSSTTSLRGQLSMNTLLRSPSENLLPREDDIMRFLGVLNDRVKERQWQFLQLSLVILAETTDALLGNIPSLLLKKAGLKLVLQAILLIATIETFKAYILAAYNEFKHGGYQDTLIDDFKLKFIDSNRLSLEFSSKEGGTRIRHETRLDQPTAAAFTHQGLVKMPQNEQIKATVLDDEELAGWHVNRAIMDRLLAGIPVSAAGAASAKHRRLPDSANFLRGVEHTEENSLQPFIYLKLLTLDAKSYLALLSWLYKVDYSLGEAEIISWQIPHTYASESAHFTRVIDALSLPQFENSQIIYPAFIEQSLMQALERYRHATATNYVMETNRLHRLQYIALSHLSYLNFNFAQLQHYLVNHCSVDISGVQITRIDWHPFIVSTLTLEQAISQRYAVKQKYNGKPQFIFAKEIPANVMILLHQYLNATPEQLLSERATRLTNNRRAGLGIGMVKSLYTPYFSLPAALFLSSRVVRYGFDREEFMAMTFEHCQLGQCREVGLLEVLHRKLAVQLQSNIILRGNAMLRREIEGYLSASDADRENERKNSALYQAIYSGNGSNRIIATDFILKISLKYSASDFIKPEVLITLIDSYTSATVTLQQALEDQTDNTLIAFPDYWPAEACIEFDAYRQTRFGNILPPDFSL
ncbi:hypothetical protein SC206_09175 [Rouxiella sp. T17]|uniref:hypothetical protein n=1 Tax=Rouxiella sp. T17 TaxID=3085684 RepID=UPI002FC5B300